MISPFSQYLAEVFDQPYPLRVMKTTGSGKSTTNITYAAKTDEGDQLNVDFMQWGGEGRWRIDFDVNQSVHMTGAGKPWRILATVMDGIRKFMGWYRKAAGTAKHPYPEQFIISFSSSEFSRYRTYTAMIRRFAHKYGYTIGSIFDDSGMDETIITLERQR